ncbi:MAG: XkdN-like protein [Candidatus Carbobacillus sp.]|nr:XkdN-like protein [Candidatus Carbobacillus sp.]
MRRLKDFLLEGTRRVGQTKDVTITVAEESMQVTIRAISYDDYEDIRRGSLILKGNQQDFRIGKFNLGLVLAGTVDPNFKDATLLEKAGVSTPEDLIKTMLLPGEIEALAQEILKLSGLNTSINELKEEAKN